jgi:hypothetical protein
MMIILQTLELYCNAPPSQQKGQVTVTCAASRTAAESKAKQYFKQFQQQKITGMKQELAKALESWIDKACQKCDTWASTINCISYGFIIKKHGCHSTKKAGEHNWNNDLLAAVRTTLDPTFIKLQNDIALRLGSEVGQILSSIIEQLGRTLLDNPAATVAGVNEDFISGLELRAEEMERQCQEACEALSKKLRTIQDNAVTLGRESYFPSIIDRAYELAKQAKPKGRITTHIARCTAFKDALQSRDGPFPALARKIIRECNKAIEESRNDFLERIQEVFHSIEFDADNACPNASEDADPKAQAFRDNLLGFCAETRKLIKEKIVPCLDQASGYGLKPDGY